MKADFGFSRQAALIPLYGVLDKKPRPLDQELTIIGRARGCDMALDAPEVSNLHCVVFWAGDTLRVRDCSSRTGTRINGEVRKLAGLHDGDIFQVGPFSFKVKCPGDSPAAPVAKSVKKQEHLVRSRKNLARLALGLRKRLQGLLVNDLDSQQLDMLRKAMGLRTRIRTYGQRNRDLEQAELKLAQERAILEQAKEAHSSHVQQVEGELANRLAEADAEIHRRWQEFQHRCQEEEHRYQLARQTESHPPAEDAGVKSAESNPNSNPSLEEERLRLDAGRLALTREIEEFTIMKEQWTRQQATVAEAAARQNVQAEASLEEQRARIKAMMEQLNALQNQLRQQPKVDVQALVRENDQLKNRLRDLEERVHDHHIYGDDRQLQNLREENDDLRRLVADLEEQGAAGLLAATANETEESRKMRQEIDLLRQLMQEKDHLFEEMKQKLVEATTVKETRPESDLENYEAELNQFRHQLEADRTKLNTEIEQLRQRNQELDEATRETEMEMSRERAELARERQRLDRMREEIRADVERTQRDGAARESLAPVHKLREEMMGKKTTNPPDPMRSLRQRG